MSQKQLKKIQINGATFCLDHRYQLVMDLVLPRFEQASLIIDQLFGRDDKAAQLLIDAVLEDGCEDDVAMTYFLTMALQSYGELERAGVIIARMYHNNPSDLLAKCAYANNFMFHNALDEIPAVFNNTFDFEKVCTERELPLITFVQFMSIACTYYFVKNDSHNCIKYLSYLLEAAPEHPETKRVFSWIERVCEKDEAEA